MTRTATLTKSTSIRVLQGPPPIARKGTKKLRESPRFLRAKKPITIAGGVKKHTIVLGPRPKSNSKINPSAQVNKVRTFEAEQKAKRQATARYKNKANGYRGEVEVPPARNFKRGSNILCCSI